MDQSFEDLIRIAARESMEKNSYRRREADGILMILHQTSEVISKLMGAPLQIKLVPNSSVHPFRYDLMVYDERGGNKELDVRIYPANEMIVKM